MSDWTISRKIGTACGAVLLILLAAILITRYDLTQVARHAEATIGEEEQEMFHASRRIDHLTWVRGLALDLLDGPAFSGQLDPAQCALGKWLATERESGDGQLPALVAAHRELHASARLTLDQSEPPALECSAR